jgi:hypothetical protein
MNQKIILTKILFAFVFLVFTWNPNLYSREKENPVKEVKIRKGTIKGKLIDKDTRAPISGCYVTVQETVMDAVTDQDGSFIIYNITVGNYTLKFTCSNITPLIKTDIIVKSKKITFISVEMDITPMLKEIISVSPEYFIQSREQSTGVTNYTSEEIRRAPGSAGDVSRIIFALPGVAKVNDKVNGLVVRGGNPSENTFFIDNIEIPNINHYPIQGTSGGRISLINVDFIQDVNFHAGGFSALYGDRLSSVMDITYRQGNTEKFEAQIDLNFAGLSAQAEGPISKGKGSWMFSARRSYLDLLVNAIGTGVAPRYSDFQGKLTFDLSPKSKISVLSILGIDDISFDLEKSLDSGNSMYGDFHSTENATGLNWFYLWNSKGYSNTSVSYFSTKYNRESYKTVTETPLFFSNSSEMFLSLRNINHYSFNHNHKIRFGVEVKSITSDYDIFKAAHINLLGTQIPDFSREIKVTSSKYGAFIDYNFNLFSNFTLTLGLRGDYFSYNKHLNMSPRLSMVYKFSEKTSVIGSTGIYNQNLPLSLLFENEKNKDLKDPRTYHVSLGLNHLITDDTLLTIEAYVKEYRNLPVDPKEPDLFIWDVISGLEFIGHENLSDTGIAYSRGIEFTIQKKLKDKFYGMISGTYSQTRYKDYNGIWRDRVFDNRFIFSIEGGYKPNKRWDFSLRYIYAGGVPYTPFDIEASTALNTGIYDSDRINSLRQPAYHSLNIRVDKRLYFRSSNLTIYLDVWNAYNRKNIAYYYWNEIENKQDQENQWSLLPIIGVEFEF